MRLLLLLLVWQTTVGIVLAQKTTLSSKPTNTLFAIKAVDDKTEAELSAKFTIRASLAKKDYIGTSKPGTDYTFLLTRADTLDVIVNVPGYTEAEEVMVVTCDTCANYGYAVRMEKADTVFRNLQTGQAIQLDKVFFDQSSYHLRSESFEQLDKLLRTLQTTPALRIEIAGHTDNVGDRRLNQLLSEQRAKVIANYLVTKGIPDTRLRANGYGGTRPAAPNDVEENKRKNRRVEFVVLAK
ncbi:OmpA family protein [Fibrella sp. HMF5335]|uniref:OmpA family protein n=1 Tax=Fibrella rubiginis TaxID=2817060 RepID=A0A939GJK1_9BACT|nr:OmpA family protein [Fibrella rubiginis]MBO0938630.1 OmpA family protein [Fibrella rubiginis]